MATRSFQVAGTFVGDTDACRADALALITNRLRPLDHIMRLEDSEHVTNSLQLKFNLLRMCAAMIFGHWAGSMPPEQTDLGAAYSDATISAAVATLVAAADSPAGRADLALACAAQPAANGGLGITTDYAATAHTRFVACFIPCWSACRRVNPDLAAMPIQASPAGAAPASPTIASFCASYDHIAAAATDLRRRHTAIALQRVHWVDGSTHRPYHPRTAIARPGSLPATAALAFDDAVSTPLSRFSQRALMAVVNDTAWLDLQLRCAGFDAANTAAVVPHREATRLVSCSQEGSGAFVARLPDSTLEGSVIGSSSFLVILQRRLGLYLSPEGRGG